MNGNIHVVIRDSAGNVVSEHISKNMVTTSGLEIIRDYLASSGAAGAPLGPTMMSVGSGLQAITPELTSQPGETYRVAISEKAPDGEGLVFHGVIPSYANNAQTVGNYGLWAGYATSATGSGILFAIAQEQFPYEKTAGKSLNIDWTMTVSGLIS